MYIIKVTPYEADIDQIEVIEQQGRDSITLYRVYFPNQSESMYKRVLALCNAFCYHYGILVTHRNDNGIIKPINNINPKLFGESYPTISKTLIETAKQPKQSEIIKRWSK